MNQAEAIPFSVLTIVTGIGWATLLAISIMGVWILFSSIAELLGTRRRRVEESVRFDLWSSAKCFDDHPEVRELLRDLCDGADMDDAHRQYNNRLAKAKPIEISDAAAEAARQSLRESMKRDGALLTIDQARDAIAAAMKEMSQ